MSNNVNKILLFSILILISSCFKRNQCNEIYIEFKNYSTNIISSKQYNIIYSSAVDSINNWIGANLKQVNYLNKYNWQLDSLICFNKYKNRCIMAILVQDKNGPMDDIHYFYGVNINENWYYFIGATLYLPRKNYQKTIENPINFPKMHEIALFEIFGEYLIKNGRNNWAINDDFFSKIPNKNHSVSGYGSCIECKTEEEYYLYLVNKNWNGK